MKKQIFSSLLALAMVVGMLPTVALADEVSGVTLTETLDLTSVTEDVTDQDGYTWDKDSLTLTILEAGLEISVEEINGLTLPAGTTLVLDGDLDISTNWTAISAAGDLTISGSGDLSADDICVEGKFILEESVRIITEKISTGGNITINDTVTVFVTYNIWAYYEDLTVDIASTATVNGIVSVYIYENPCRIYTDTVYGEMNVTDENYYYAFEGTNMAFASGSKLTVFANISTDWSGYTTITWDNAKISNYGTITLPDGTEYNDVPWSSISGTGYVMIGDTAYDCNGDATTAPYYGTLTLESGVAFDGSAYGFTWTKSEGSGVYDTLTITEAGLTIIASDENEDGLVLPAGTKIILNGDLNITSSDGDGIEASGDLSIEGAGNLTINASSNAGIYIGAEAATLTMNSTGHVTINARYGINASNDSDVVIYSGALEINASSYGIHAYNGDITIDSDDDITITTTGESAVGIYAYTGDLDLDFGGTVLITSEYGIEASGANAEINVDGSLIIYSTGTSIYANPDDTSTGITLTGNGTIVANAQMFSYGAGSIAETLTVTGWMQYRDYTNAADTNDYDQYCDIYGDITLAYRSSDYSAYGTITFHDGASITIEENAVLDFSYGVVEINANIINNGILILSDDDYDAEDLADLGIEGSGMIGLYDDYTPPSPPPTTTMRAMR